MSMSKKEGDILATITPQLNTAGFDICHPACLNWYNEGIPTDIGVHIPEKATSGQDAFCVLVGNSCHLWPIFLHYCALKQEVLQSPNPLDEYVEDVIFSTVNELSQHRLEYRVYFSHKKTDDLLGGGHYIAMQRFAHFSGLAYLDHNIHLAIHKEFGPWFALRALIVFDNVKCTLEPPVLMSDPLSDQQRSRAIKLMEEAVGSNDATYEALSRRWRKWVAIRDCISESHPARYCEGQLEYHYTSNKALLKACVNEVINVKQDLERSL